MEQAERQKTMRKRTRPSALTCRLLKIKRTLKACVLHVLNPRTKFGVAFITAVATVLATKGMTVFSDHFKPNREPPRREQSHKQGKNVVQFLQLFQAVLSAGHLSSQIQDADVLMCPECSRVMTVPKDQGVTVTCNACQSAYQNILLLAKGNEGRDS